MNKATFCSLLLALCYAGNAQAGDILRGGASGSNGGAPSAYYGGNQAAMAQLQKNSTEILARTVQALQSAQALQQAARNVALQGSNNLGLNPRSPGLQLPNVPNGLAPGALQVAPGVGSNPALWQGAHLPSQSVANGQTTVTIQQTAPKAILNWQTFNVGKNTIAYFNQSAGGALANTWVSLNRILDPSGLPSQILGSIRAEGSVYLINQNGIIFGGSSQVNVHSLIASALGLTNTQFEAGIINQQAYTTINFSGYINAPAFSNTSGPAGNVAVQAGAVIQTASPPSATEGGGSVYLFGANVENDGTIITPDGQTVLAAAGQPTTVTLPVGSSGIPGTNATSAPRSSPQTYTFPSDVYLATSSNSNIRGVTVLMDNGGTVTNKGVISASTGNITMTGMTIQQFGVLAATTSVDEAGSITLFAGSGGPQYAVGQLNNYGLAVQITNNFVSFAIYAAQAGTVDLSNGSLTAVLPEENGRTAMDTQPQAQSTISIEGQNINLLSGSTVFAPAGRVALEASNNPSLLYSYDHPGMINASFIPDTGRVWVDTGATIDVAGLAGISVPAQENAVKVTVRANELRDAPLQRNGILESQNVWVDSRDLVTVASDRVYTPGGLLEVSGWLGLIERPIDQRLATGGSVTIFSGGDAVLRPGSIVNISGGSLDHQAGQVPTTWLIGADGHIYSIDQAPADLIYTSINGLFAETHPRWGVTLNYANPFLPAQIYEPGYVEGKPAGTLSVIAPLSEIDSSVSALTVSGPYQRTASSTPTGGALIIGEYDSRAILIPTDVVIEPSVAAPELANNTSPLPKDWQQTLYLSANVIDQAGYGSIAITAGSGLTDPVTGASVPGLPGITVASGASLQAAPGGSISLTALGGILVDGQLIARAGSVTLNTTLSYPKSLPIPAPTHDIVLQSGSLIDTRGLWVNDFVAGNDDTPALYNGGNVILQSYDNVWIDNGVVIDASSGGWVKSNGKLATNSNGLPVGTGGNITVISDYAAITENPPTPPAVSPPQTYPARIYLSGILRSYGFTAGGQLSLTTPIIQIGGTDPSATKTDANTAMRFDPRFFATGGFSQYALYSYQGLTIVHGADLELHATNFLSTPALRSAPTGADVARIAPIGTAPAFEQPGPVNLNLSATDAYAGDLVMEPGSTINADPQATIALHASHQLTVDGTIYTPGGTIALDLTGSAAPAGNFFPYYAAPYYQPTQTLWIGADARLLAPGMVAEVLGPLNSPVDFLLDGGSVNINQEKQPSLYYPYPLDVPPSEQPLGVVVAQPGAVIDVSGASGTILETGRSGFSPTLGSHPVATSGGTIAITASLGLLFDATMKAQGGGPGAAGGNFIIDQIVGAYPGINIFNDPNFVAPLFMLVVSEQSPMLSEGIRVGQPIPLGNIGELFIGADQIMNSGFSSASLGAVDAIVFNGSVNLTLSRSLTINARNVSDGRVTSLAQGTYPTISDGAVVAPSAGAVVNLSAPYVDIGGGQRNTALESFSFGPPPSATAAALAGTAELNIYADLIDIEGLLRSGASYSYPFNFSNLPNAVSLAGFKSMSFISQGDIRLIPFAGFGGPSSLTTQGNLAFTATEIYPITTAPYANASNTGSNTIFLIQAGGIHSSVTFARNDQTPYTPLSAGGQMEIIAPTINQGGVLLAPLGLITFGDPNNLTSAESINLLPGSITSVSASGALIPYGTPVGKSTWDYQGAVLFGPPAKLISFYGQNVTVSGASGGSPAALIDESGGGDIYGAQFVSGAGGSVDTLNGTETFSVLPGLGNHYAPRDPLMQSSNPVSGSAVPPVDLKVGNQVYLSGLPGLPAGYYTLLPGHYALLPGGYKLTVAVSGTTANGLTNVALPDGSYRVLGYRSVSNTTLQDSLPSIFVVTPGSVVRTQSQFAETNARTFFPAQAVATSTIAPYLPQDAGYLIIDLAGATGTLIFQGVANFSAPPGARGGQADIVAQNLDILGPEDTAQAGYIGIQANQLNALGVESLLIGGLRNLSTDNSLAPQLVITPSMQNLVIDTNAVLTGSEIMLTATAFIHIASNARIDTTGSPAIANQFPTDPVTGKILGSILVSGNPAALVIASNAIPLPVTRTAGASTLTIDAGADIFAGKTLLLSADNFSLDTAARFAAPTITVQVPFINIGAGGTGGLTLTSALLSTLSQGDPSRNLPATTDLVLDATQAINVYGSESLGGIDPATGRPTLGQLTLNAPAVNGFGSASDNVTLIAGKVTLLGASTPLRPRALGTAALPSTRRS
jgi:filamentous hemagglutinin family protein